MSKKFIFVNPDGDYEESAGSFEIADFINVTTGAADAGKPIITDATGKLDPSFYDFSDIDHGSLSGLGDDDHPQYLLIDGSRAMTGSLNAGGFDVINLPQTPTGALSATSKSYVDALAVGLRPHGNCRVATVANIDLANAPAVIDGATLVAGNRVLVKDQTAATENGIYVFNGAGIAMTRAEDFDNSPQGEVWNGSFIPKILEGTYTATPFVLISVGTGVDGLHTLGTDNLVFDEFTSPSQLQEGNGINFNGNVVEIDLLDADSGLSITLGAGNELGIVWATDFTVDAASALAFKASDLASTVAGKGASFVGIQDAANVFTSNNVEGALYELYGAAVAPSDSNLYTAAVAIAKGDLVYFSGNGEVSPVPTNQAKTAVGIAKTAAAIGAQVEVLKQDAQLTACLTGATAGTKYYWDGAAYTTSIPNGSGAYVWMVGVAINATDLQVAHSFLKRNSL
jgi:hypothetical protein